MRRIFIGIIAVAAPLFLPVAGISQTRGVDACQFYDNPDLQPAIIGQILGSWNQYNDFGYVLVAGTEFLFPPADSNDSITFAISGTDLVGSTPEMQEPILFELDRGQTLSGAGDGPAGFQRQFGRLVFDTKNAAGCELSDLPQLIGKTNITVEGITMEFIWRLTITGPSTMYVVQDVSGNAQGFEYFSRRTVELTR